MRNWLKNSKEYKQTFQDIINQEVEKEGTKPDAKAKTNSDKEAMQTLYTYFKEVMETIRNKEKYYNTIQEYIQTTKKGETVVVQSDNREMFDYMVEIFKQASEEKQFLKFIEYQDKITQRVQKEAIVSAISYMGTVFDSFNYLNRYQSYYNKRVENIGKEELFYEMETKDNKIGVRNFFSEEFLEKLSIEELEVLHCYWSNRMAKELEDINHAYFVLCSCNLREGISEEGIEQILLKLEILKAVETKVEKEVFKEKQEQIEKGELKTNYISEDASQITTKLLTPIEKDYQTYFKEKLPKCKNKIREDFEYFHMAANATQIAYQLKFNSACSFISSLYGQKNCKNWGIKKEEVGDNKKNIVFCADYEGFNVPLRVHLDKNKLFEFIEKNEEKRFIPIYKGDEDMIINGQYFRSSLLMPLDKDKKKKLQSLAKTIKPRR